MKNAHGICWSMVKIGAALEFLHDLSHDAYGGAAISVGPAGVRGPSMRGEEKALEGVASRRDRTPHALGGLRNQHVFMSLGLRLDQRARGWTADLFIRVNDERHRQVEF